MPDTLKKILKIVGPILLLLIPVAIAVGIWWDEQATYDDGGAYVQTPGGQMEYALDNPEQYGLDPDVDPVDY